MVYPKISIVTPSFNQGQYIEETILSIINQGYHNLEYIIIDGGSTDGTVEIIKKYAQYLKYWVSEKDNDQADAINKGLKHCSGEIFNWINSDDFLEPGAVFKVANAFLQNQNAGIVAGCVCNFNESGEKSHYQNRNLSIDKYFGEEEDYRYHQPGVWLRLKDVRQVGDFDISYHYCFDQEHLIRYLMYNKNVVYLQEVLVNFRLHDSSKTVTQFKKFYTEWNRVIKSFLAKNPRHTLASSAKLKHESLNWTIMHQSIMGEKRSRIKEFIAISREMLRHPARNFNRKNIGWLKHVLFRPKQ